MPEYLSPGVYVEEISTGPRPIEGVSTSTAGFVGLTERGPEYPLMVTSWMEFQRWFGSYLSPDESYMSYAVQGFFDNGGQRLFIARVIPGVAKAAGMTAPKRAQATIGDLTVQSIGRGDWANRVYYAVEQASKARATADPNSPVKKWIKLTLLYYSHAPKSKAFKAFDTVQQVSSLVADTNTAAEKAKKDADDASAAATTLGTTDTEANRTAARLAVDKSKESSAKLAELVGKIVDAVKAAQTESVAALAASPDDAALKTAKEAADTALGNATTAKDSADKAATATSESAAQDPPTVAKATAAATASATAKTDWDTAASDITTMTDTASDAYPALAAQSLAAQAVTDAATAKQAAQDAKQPITDSLAVGATDDQKKAAKAAADKAKIAAEKSSDTANALKSAVGKISASADDLKAAKDAVEKAVQSAATALADATACATEPLTTAKSDTAIASAGVASADADAAVAPVNAAANAVQATAPVMLSVNPMVQENRLNADFRTPDVVEVYDNLRIPAGASNSLLVTVNSASQLVVLDLQGLNVPHSGTEPGPADPPIPIFTALAGGAAGTGNGGKPTLADFKGSPDPIDSPDGKTAPFGTGLGLAGLAAIEGISLLAAPDEVTVDSLSQEVINQCELLRDRFGVVSAKQGQSNISNLNPTQDTTFAAFYYPWIWVFDPVSNGPLLIPPTGHVTGLIARTDIERGVHKAPANEVLRDAVDLEFPIPKGKQDILNPKGVNCVRDFRPQGRSIRLWGARTMTSDPEWKYINVRRLFIFVEQSILRGTNWVVFEPNDQLLWAKVRLSISAFLIAVWKSGALMGTTQEEAFFVRCDRTTMTQNDIDNGRLVCLIGIAPVKPAEFVIFRISQKMQEVAE